VRSPSRSICRVRPFCTSVSPGVQGQAQSGEPEAAIRDAGAVDAIGLARIEVVNADLGRPACVTGRELANPQYQTRNKKVANDQSHSEARPRDVVVKHLHVIKQATHATTYI
jgi:hypothetical protein